jgi:hypothetical protein
VNHSTLANGHYVWHRRCVEARLGDFREQLKNSRPFAF